MISKDSDKKMTIKVMVVSTVVIGIVAFLLFFPSCAFDSSDFFDALKELENKNNIDPELYTVFGDWYVLNSELGALYDKADGFRVISIEEDKVVIAQGGDETEITKNSGSNTNSLLICRGEKTLIVTFNTGFITLEIDEAKAIFQLRK